MKIRASQVKELRERTGVGMMDCKQALEETAGDVDEAIKVLRRMGKAKIAKRAGREVSEGRVEAYVHTGDKLAVLVEVNCETDFVARSKEFESLAHSLALHIAAASPRFIRSEDVDEATLAEERAVYLSQAQSEGKPADIAERIVEGKMSRFLSEAVLYEQPFIRDPDHSVSDIISDAVNRIGENIVVRRFVRIALGDGEATVVSTS
ncbi:MAG: translation elongation factor Ts [Acidobacteriota bacterium]